MNARVHTTQMPQAPSTSEQPIKTDTTEQRLAWRTLRARIAKAAKRHEADIPKRVAEVRRLREQHPTMFAEITDEQLATTLAGARKIARKRAVADERGQSVSAPAAKGRSQRRKLHDMNTAAAVFWKQDAEQLELLLQKYPDALAHLLMDEARITVDAFSLATGQASHAAAVRSAEAHDQLRKQRYKDVRQRANSRRKADADNQVINEYRAWGRRVTEVQCLSDAERVTRYLRVKPLPASKRRRLRALLKAGKL